MRQDLPDEPDTLLSFAPETSVNTGNEGLPPGPAWKILIADDDAEVHRITRMVLTDLIYENRPLRIHSAYSGKETFEFMKENPDTAILILDVVMENDIAGLKVANRIREELANRSTRILLRTGQAGKAPEYDVVSHYGINDYKEKSELTAQKLRSTVITALRNFREIRSVEQENHTLQRLLALTSSPTPHTEAPAFASTVVAQLARLLAPAFPRNIRIRFTARSSSGKTLCACLQEHLPRPEPLDRAAPFSCFAPSPCGRSMEMIVTTVPALSQNEQNSVRLFTHHIGEVLDRLLDHQPEIQGETRFSSLLEHALIRSRKRESAGHLQRVGAFAQHLALQAGLGRDAAEELRRVSPLHDIGKLAIPQDILEKTGPLSPEEKAVIRTHPDIGYELLHAENRPDLQSAAIVAREHHERWDGLGYPLGLSGEKIHIYGRITAIADVFDALIHDRCYKKAWSLSEAAAFLQSRAGSLFDPDLVPCFTADMTPLARIHRAWPGS